MDEKPQAPKESDDLSDDALSLWSGFFLNPKSTLTFGGEGAEYHMTMRGRNALDELLSFGAVLPIEPDCACPGVEVYGSEPAGNLECRKELNRRAGNDLFTWMEALQFTVFERASQ